MTRKRLSTAERRAAILESAGAHFGTRPYPAVAVASIAADADASQALVFHYFSTKAGLYTELIDARLARQRENWTQALSACTGQPVRLRIEAVLLAHLDTVAADPLLTAGPGEPDAARHARERAGSALSDLIGAEIGINDFARHRWAVTGIVGFLGHSCERWFATGCPDNERRPLLEATLGALEGALGDWRV